MAAKIVSAFLDVEGPLRPAWPPTVSKVARDLIRTMSRANPVWGAPRIHGELLKMGIDIGQTNVAKYMLRRRFARRFLGTAFRDTSSEIAMELRPRLQSKQIGAFGIEQVLSAPRSPWQRAYVERVIGTIRRNAWTTYSSL